MAAGEESIGEGDAEAPDSGAVETRRPTSAYSPEEIRHGMRWMVIAWLFGAAFCSVVGAGYAPFLKKILLADDVWFGIINAIGPAAVVFLFIGSLNNERTGRAKRTFVGFVLPSRLIWLAVAAIPLVFHRFPNAGAAGFICVVMFLGSAAANYGSAGWTVWMADIVPKSKAGAYFALRSTAGLWSMIVVGMIAGWIFGKHETDAVAYTWMFAIAGALGAIDIVFCSRVPEKPRPISAGDNSIAHILSVPWKNGLFRAFSLYSAITWFSYAFMGTFVWPFMNEPANKGGLNLGIFVTNLFISILPMVSMALIAPFWGRAIDRFGPKPVLGIGSFSAAVMPIAWMFIHRGGGFDFTIGPWPLHADMIWLIPLIQILGGLTWPAVEQGVFYVQINDFPEDRRSAYIAAYQVVLQIASMAGAFAAGLCAKFWETHMHWVPWFPKWFSHYQPVFLIAILIRLGVFVIMYPRLRIEGTAEYHEVAKAVASDAKSVVPKLGRKRTK